MTFEEYMESKVPGYKSLFPEEVLPILKKDFDLKESYRLAREKAMDMALNHNTSGIDYTTTMQKNMDNENRYSMILESKIEQIKQQLGIVEEEKETTSHK